MFQKNNIFSSILALFVHSIRILQAGKRISAVQGILEWDSPSKSAQINRLIQLPIEYQIHPENSTFFV